MGRMAEARKKETLTLEEKIEQALVMIEEQPYEVPENWCWVKVGMVCVFENGYAFKSDKFSEQGTMPVIRISNIRQNEIDIASCVYTTETDVDNRFIAKYGDLLIAMSGATTGKNGVFLSNVPAYINQRVGNIKVRDERVLLPAYRNYYIMAMEEEIFRGAYGGTQPNISSNKICDMNMPLAPLSEQQRIVKMIESLFMKLDVVKEKINNVLKRCDANIAIIVHKAVTGELTEAWRRKQGILKEEWIEDKLGNLGTLERGRSKHRPRNDPRLFGGQYPFIQTGDVAEANVYIEKHRQTLSEVGVKQSRIFPKGTLCITIAANIGDVAILSYDCCFPDSIVGFTPYANVESKYIYYMISELQKEIEANAPATAQKNINLKILNDIDIKVPTLAEQKKIIEICDELLGKEMEVKKKAEQTIGIIEMMRKSILAKAFRGELGTNNPKEENIIELLKFILAEE